MSSPATWALELLRRRSPLRAPRPARLRSGPRRCHRAGAERERPAPPPLPAPGAQATHKFEPSEGGVKASSSLSDSNPRVQETVSSDSRDEPALSEVGSGKERSGNPGCSGEGMRAVQYYGCTPANAQPSQRHPHTRRNLLGVGMPPFSVLRASLYCVASAVSQQSSASHPQRSRPAPPLGSVPVGRGDTNGSMPETPRRHRTGVCEWGAQLSCSLTPRVGKHTEKPVCNKTEISYFVCFSGEWQGLTPTCFFFFSSTFCSIAIDWTEKLAVKEFLSTFRLLCARNCTFCIETKLFWMDFLPREPTW